MSHSIIFKRKRTIRIQHNLPPPPQSQSQSQSQSNTDEQKQHEEAEMVNCLMLLSKGDSFPPKKPPIFLHQCKTCNKCFSSFQALGGHRASHRKPKTTAFDADALAKQLASSSSSSSTSSTVCGGKQRTHECLSCGSEFPSGQALGGHMRRHRLEVDKKEKRVFMFDLNLPAPNDDDPFVAAAAALVGCHY